MYKQTPGAFDKCSWCFACIPAYAAPIAPSTAYTAALT